MRTNGIFYLANFEGKKHRIIDDVKPFSVSERLKALRAASGLTQEAFAELAGMDYKTYQHIEAGRRPSVRLCTIEKNLCRLSHQVVENHAGTQTAKFFIRLEIPVLNS